MKFTDSRFFLSCLVISLFMVSGCQQPSTPITGSSLDTTDLKEDLEEAHKTLNEREKRIINQYVARHDLKLTNTPTGLRYRVYKQGSGANALPGNLVRFTYTVSLINGIEIEKSEPGIPSELLLEKAEAISGLHELLGKLNTGAKAKAIIPSFLAYGFSGEQGRIPKGATLVYDVEVLEIINLK